MVQNSIENVLGRFHHNSKQIKMVFPPTRAAYEALINEVKLLKEENKQLRNEIKETSRSTLHIELEPEKRYLENSTKRYYSICF